MNRNRIFTITIYLIILLYFNNYSRINKKYSKSKEERNKVAFLQVILYVCTKCNEVNKKVIGGDEELYNRFCEIVG